MLNFRSSFSNQEEAASLLLLHAKTPGPSQGKQIMPVPCLGVTSVGPTRPAADVGSGRVSGISPRGEGSPLAFDRQNGPSDVDFRGVQVMAVLGSSMCSNVRLATRVTKGWRRGFVVENKLTSRPLCIR